LNEILIVGNGSTLLNQKNGAKIDTFQKVVRFNSFKIKSFEDFVGTRTTSWVTCNRCHLGEKFDEVIFHSWTKDKNSDPLFLKFQKEYPSIKILDHGLIKQANELLKIGKFKAPSTGLLTILHYLNKFDQVMITGFDWWANSRHHYGDNERRGTLHQPDIEMKAINKLILDGKLRFL
jgi:hypothetical protein